MVESVPQSLPHLHTPSFPPSLIYSHPPSLAYSFIYFLPSSLIYSFTFSPFPTSRATFHATSVPPFLLYLHTASLSPSLTHCLIFSLLLYSLPPPPPLVSRSLISFLLLFLTPTVPPCLPYVLDDSQTHSPTGHSNAGRAVGTAGRSGADQLSPWFPVSRGRWRWYGHVPANVPSHPRQAQLPGTQDARQR